MWIRENFEDGIRDDSVAAQVLADLAESMAAQGDTDLALKLLSSASLRCFWAQADSRSRQRVVTVAEGLPVDDLDGRLLAILAFAAPIERGKVVIDRLRQLAVHPAGNSHVARLLGSSEAQPVHDAAGLDDLRSVRRRPVVTSVINEYDHAA